eukprot:gene8773-721_t
MKEEVLSRNLEQTSEPIPQIAVTPPKERPKEKLKLELFNTPSFEKEEKEENGIDPKIQDLLSKSITKNEYTKLKYDLSQTITYILRNLTIVMRNPRYNNHLNRLYLILQKYNEEEENEKMERELELLKEMYSNLQKKKKNSKLKFEEIFEIEMMYQKLWDEFLKKNQDKCSHCVCFVDYNGNFTQNRWILKMESKIDEIPFLSNSRNISSPNHILKEENEKSFKKFVENKLKIELETENWENEKLFHFSEFRLNFYRYTINSSNLNKIKSLNDILPNLVKNSTDLDIFETVNFIEGGNRSLKGTFLSDIESSFTKFVKSLNNLKIREYKDLIHSKKITSKQIDEIYKKTKKNSDILKESYPLVSKKYIENSKNSKIENLKIRLNFIDKCLVELNLTNSLLDLYASLNNSKSSISTLNDTLQDSKLETTSSKFWGYFSPRNSSLPTTPPIKFSNKSRRKSTDEFNSIPAFTYLTSVFNQEVEFNEDIVDPMNPLEFSV